MMKTVFLSAALAVVSVAAAAPAAAVVIVPGSSGLLFDPFDASTRGTELAFNSFPGVAPTIQGTLASAVYQNTLGGLDFYFQVYRTGGTDQIDGLNVGDYSGLSVQGFVDGTGTATGFVMPMNPPASTTTVGRSADGGVVQVDFGSNGLSGTEISTVYIFRTDATAFTPAFATVTNSTSFNALAFGPTAAIPEPATWAMMIGGFGLVGGAMRRRRATGTIATA